MKSGLSYNKGVFKELAVEMAEKVQNLEKAIEFQLITYVAPETVKYAKTFKTYQDQTSNLVSSKGFVLAKNGKIISLGGFEAKGGEKGDGAEGVKKGKEYAEELARSAGKGYALIIVAGMKYAGYVESKGFDVLTQAGTYLESEVKGMIDDVKKAGFR